MQIRKSIYALADFVFRIKKKKSIELVDMIMWKLKACERETRADKKRVKWNQTNKQTEHTRTQKFQTKFETWHLSIGDIYM